MLDYTSKWLTSLCVNDITSVYLVLQSKVTIRADAKLLNWVDYTWVSSNQALIPDNYNKKEN